MMPQIGQAAEKPPDPPDPGELITLARAALAQAEPSRESLLRRAASGDGNARVLLAEMVVLRDFAAKVEAAWLGAATDAARNLRHLCEENARLRADLEEARRRHPRRRHAADRPPWLRAAPMAVVPAGLRLLGHHAAAKAVLGTVAASTAAVVAIGAGVTQTVPYQTPAPAHHAAWHAPAAVIYGAVRVPRDAAASSPQARTAAQSASPVPVVTPPPAASSAPPVPPSPSPSATAVVPVLTVPRLLDLGAVTRGPLILTAGPDAVTWTVTATDGIEVLENGAAVRGGTLAAGQELDLTVTAPTGSGVIHFWVGTDVFTVVVSSDVGAPAMPSGL